jgi:isoquinoline 1-oxidoreductase beta subunit
MMLEEAAAKQRGVPVSDVEAKNHKVVHKSTGKTLGYGEFAADAAKLDVPATDSLRLKDPSQFRYIGKEGTNIVDGFDITTGRAKYGQDIRLPGQKYAVIARPPVMGGKVASYDASETKKVPGVVEVVKIPAPSYPMVFQPSGGIGVIADNTWAAMQGRKALKITWDDGPHATYNSSAYRAAMEATARQPGLVLRSEGDFAAAFAGAAKKVEAEYYIPHNAHATMEPPVATCQIVDGKAEVWTSVQSPQAAHDLVAKYLGLSGENVTVNVTLLGGGFGRKSKPDYAVEAALCSKAVGGAPVKVVWTREDDIRNDFYHTVSVERLEAGLDKDGKVVAWRHNSVAPTIGALFVAPDPRHELNWELGQGMSDLPFDFKNISLENGRPRRTPKSAGGAPFRTCRTGSRFSLSPPSWPTRRARIKRRSCST